VKIVIGADEAGFEYKEALSAILSADPRVTSLVDVGLKASEDTPYPNVAFLACESIIEGASDRGILICGTGIGMQIAANKVHGIRATVVSESYSVERSVLSNNCQVITFGAKVISFDLLNQLAMEWLNLTFDPSSNSAIKIQVISEYEDRGN
jgi:ribose 5-phosphate isomerase B